MDVIEDYAGGGLEKGWVRLHITYAQGWVPPWSLFFSLSVPPFPHNFAQYHIQNSLPADAPVLILLPGLTGGSGCSYVLHAVRSVRGGRVQLRPACCEVICEGSFQCICLNMRLI